MARLIDELYVLLGSRVDSKGWDEANKRLGDFKSKANGLAQNIGIAGAALTGIQALTTRTILGFEQAMNTLKSVYLEAASPADIARLREQAMILGRTTSKTASDAANAQVALARLGFTTQEVYEAIPSILNLAISGELSIAEAAELVGKQIRAFNLDASEAARIADVMQLTASKSATNVLEMSDAFRQLGPLARMANVSIEQTSAMIGQLRTAGLQAGQAGTAVRNLILLLIRPPTSAAKTGWERLGIDPDVIKQMVIEGDIFGAFRIMRDAGFDLEAAGQVFNRFTATAGATLVERIDEIEMLSGALDNAAGTADRARHEVESGLPGAWYQFKSALEGAQLALGESGLTAAATLALKILRQLFSMFAQLPSPIQAVVSGVIALGPLLLGLAAGIKLLTFTITVLQGVLGVWHGQNIAIRVQLGLLALQQWATTAATYAQTFAMSLLSIATWVSAAAWLKYAIITGIATIITIAAALPVLALTIAMWALNVAINAIPFMIIATALIVLGALVWKFRRQIWGFLIGVFNWIKRNWPYLLPLLLGPFGVLIAVAYKFRDKILGPLKDVWNGIKSGFGSAIEWIVGAFEWFVAQYTRHIKPIVDEIVDFVNSVGGFLGGILGKIGGAFNWLFSDTEGNNIQQTGTSPPPPPPNVQTTRARTTNVNVENVAIETQATNAKDLATEFRGAMEDEYQNAAFAADSEIDR